MRACARVCVCACVRACACVHAFVRACRYSVNGIYELIWFLHAHSDGARLFNASALTGVPVLDYAAQFDSVSVCLSKGLGAPIGSVLAGKSDMIISHHTCVCCSRRACLSACVCPCVAGKSDNIGVCVYARVFICLCAYVCACAGR